jgi:RHS repeat-associated protein
MPGLGRARSVGYIAGTGSALEGLPIDIAPGRKRFQPNLSFVYSSMAGLADLGLGWSAEVGRVVRSSTHGIPTTTGPDEFLLSLPGAGDTLIPIGGGAYRPRFESTYRRHQFVGDHWEVTDGQGTVFAFGSAPESRIDGLDWRLDRVRDTNGNTITIAYLRDGGQLYPSEIRYTGFAPTADPGVNRVVFDYEDRVGDARISFALGVEQRSRKRLHRVSSFAGASLVRAYEVEYGESATTKRSLVSGIDLIGADDSSRIPARRYGYQNAVRGFGPSVKLDPFPVAFNDDQGRDTGARSVDVNGDGFVDVLDNGTHVWLGDGQGHFDLAPDWSANFAGTGLSFVDSNALDTGTRLVDVNGDLRPDLIVSNPSSQRILLNTGRGWEETSTLARAYTSEWKNLKVIVNVERRFVDPACQDGGSADAGDCSQTVPRAVDFSLVNDHGDSSGANLADLNSDGLVDIVFSFDSTDSLVDFTPDGGVFEPDGGRFPDAGGLQRVPVAVRGVFLNTGTGWVSSDAFGASLAMLPPFVRDTQLQGFDVADVNGDGAADIIRTLGGAERIVWLSNGRGWSPNADYTSSLQASQIVSLQDSKSQGLLSLDFNNDGLLDYIRADESVRIAYRNTGLGWVEDPEESAILASLGVTLADGDGVPSGYGISDVNGDGLADLILNRGGRGNSIRNATGPFPDLLAHARTAFGEQTTLQYRPSTQFDNRDASGVEQLPSLFNVVTSLTRSDGRGNSFTSTVSYAGGLFAQTRNEASHFRAFANATTTDARGVRTVRRFSQIEATAGAVTSNEIRDVGGALRSENTATYATRDAGNGITQVLLAQTEEETRDPGGSLRTRIRYRYDEHLNAIEVAKDGNVAVTGDEGRTAFTYAKNPAVGVTAALATTLIYDAEGDVHSKSVLYYDGSVTEGQITAGNVTKQVDYVAIHGPTITRRFGYDKFGNMIRIVDGNGATSTFAYDDGTQTFRVKAIDPLGRVRSSTFDPRFGATLTETDINRNVTTKVFDAFGRITRETLPGDECSPLGTRSVAFGSLGDPNAQYLQMSATETPGEAGTLDSRAMFDGFGQIYRVEAEGAAGRKIVVLTTFDDAGLKSTATEPFFDGDSAPISVLQRDALRRLTQMTDARGVTSTMTYRGTARDEFDGKGNKTTYVSDAFGKTIETHQFVGGRELVTKSFFDVAGNRVRNVDAAGEETIVRYDGVGRRTKLIDPALGTLSYEYDGNGNLTEQEGPTGKVRLEYSAANELVKKMLPDGRVFRFGRGTVAVNGVGRLTHVSDNSGSLDLRFDPRGNVVERRRTVDGRTYVTGYSWDSLGRMRRVTYPDGFAVTYEHDAAGMVQSVKDGSGQSIIDRIEYNAAGQITKTVFANGVTSDYGFDHAGLIRSIGTANSHGTALQQLDLAFDANRNVSSIGDSLQSSRSQSFEYDEIDRLTRATGGYGDERYAYDEIGNFVRKANLVFSRNRVKKQQVDCALDLNLASLSSNGIKGDRALLDCAGDLLDVGSGLTTQERTLVQKIRERASQHGGIGQSVALDYDAAGNLVQKGDLNLRYDPENYLLAVKRGEGDDDHDGHDGHDGDDRGDGDSHDRDDWRRGHFDHDRSDWHDDHDDHDDNAAHTVERNVYDASGQRVQRFAEGVTTTYIDGVYEVDDGSKKDSVRRHIRLGPTVVATIIVSRSHTKLIDEVPPDALNQCRGRPHWVDPGSPGGACAITIGRHAQSLGYGFGGFALVVMAARFRRRLGRGISHTRTFAQRLYRGLRRRPWMGGLSIFLVFAHVLQLGSPGAAYANTPNAPKPVESRYYYHLDHLGNTNVITDGQGNEFERREYRPFGEQFVRTGDALEVSLNGHEFDRATGFYYFGARHYDPVLGRFITADTQVPDGSPQALHRYVFNANNPVRFTDMGGHDFLDWIVGAVVAVFIAIAVIAIVIATGGVGAIGLVLLASAAGAAIGGAAGLVYGYFYLYKSGKITLGDVGKIFIGSFILGALVGAAVGVAVAGGLAAGATPLAKLVSDTILGAATGAVGGLIVAAQNPEKFTPDLFLGAILWGALTGALVGAAAGGTSIVLDMVIKAPTLGFLKFLTLDTIRAGMLGASAAAWGYIIVRAHYGLPRSFDERIISGIAGLGFLGAAGLLAALIGLAAGGSKGESGSSPSGPPPRLQRPSEFNGYPAVP